PRASPTVLPEGRYQVDATLTGCRAAARGRRACWSGRDGTRARCPWPRSPGPRRALVDAVTCETGRLVVGRARSLPSAPDLKPTRRQTQELEDRSQWDTRARPIHGA